MNRKLAFKSIGFMSRFLACIMFTSLLFGCTTISKEVGEPESPPSFEVPISKKGIRSLTSFHRDVEGLCGVSISKRETKSLNSFHKDIEDLREDIKDLRKDIKKSDVASQVNKALFKNQLKTFGCGCLTGVVISGLTALFTDLSTASN